MNRWQTLADGRCLWVGMYHGHGVEVYLEPSTRSPGRWVWALGIDRLLCTPWTIVAREAVADKETAIRAAFDRLARHLKVKKRSGER